MFNACIHYLGFVFHYVHLLFYSYSLVSFILSSVMWRNSWQSLSQSFSGRVYPGNHLSEIIHM